MKLSSKIVFDETFGQHSHSFYNDAKEVERQINKDNYVIGMVLDVNSNLQERMLKILDQPLNDNTGRAIHYVIRTHERYIHRTYYVKDKRYIVTIDLVMKKFILDYL